ncbi:hypothetical protein ACKF11_12825 [Methylobacillus sp. Pita2]|uniref:hypothetical protein n=1 Tax=Methylobacillus sp. Pita2 TaxID=3383245 RepID=UPI0038B698A7
MTLAVITTNQQSPSLPSHFGMTFVDGKVEAEIPMAINAVMTKLQGHRLAAVLNQETIQVLVVAMNEFKFGEGAAEVPGETTFVAIMTDEEISQPSIDDIELAVFSCTQDEHEAAILAILDKHPTSRIVGILDELTVDQVAIGMQNYSANH